LSESIPSPVKERPASNFRSQPVGQTELQKARPRQAATTKTISQTIGAATTTP
jgi:hypothetical protein